MPNLNIPLTILGVNSYSLLPDGTEYLTAEVLNCPNSIGESKKVKWKFRTDYNIEGVNLWAQIAMFQQGVINSPNAKIPICHSITFPTGLTPGKYPMSMTLPVGGNPLLNKNCTVFLEILPDSAGHHYFNILVEFYQIYDETTYQKQTGQDNHNKLFRDNVSSTNDLTINAANTCYNSSASNFCITMRLEKDNQLHPPDTFPYTDNTNPAFGGQWFAGFYNRNHHNDNPYFNTPVFQLERPTPVTNLSSSTDTHVKFLINSPSSVSKILMWVIRSDKFDNLVTMTQNYEADFKDLISTNPTLTDKIAGPVIDIIGAGGTYKVEFNIKASNLVNGAKYRMIAIVYDNAVPAVNSFISDEYTVSGIPCYDGSGFTVKSRLSDYQTEFTGDNLECVVEERMKAELKLEYAFNQWKNSIFDRLGLVVTNDLRRYLTKVEIEFFEEYVDALIGPGVIRNTFDLKTSVRTGLNTYSPQNGLTMNFSTNWSEFIYEWRNRFEDNVNCLNSYYNGVNFIPVQSTQNWAGKTIKIQWRFTFVYDDFSTVFADEIRYTQKIRVKGYESNILQVVRFDPLTNKVIDGNTACIGDKVCIAGIMTPREDDFKLIANIKPTKGNYTTIKENEVWLGDEIPQLQENPLTSEDENFFIAAGKLVARYCVDTTNFLVNLQYDFTVIAKKKTIRRRRKVEVGGIRHTENTGQRLLENQ